MLAALVVSPVAALLLAISPAEAQPQIRVSIGTFNSTQSCQTYTVTSGSLAAGASHTRIYGLGSHSSAGFAASWRTDLVRDCVDNFPQLKTSLASALAASGRIAVVPPGTRGALVLNGRISDVGASSHSMSTTNASQGSTDANLNVEFSLLDRGAARTGGTITKRVSFAGNYETGTFSSTSSSSANTVYNELQREAALAVARSVAFSVAPPYVVTATNQRARINYGAPLVTTGMTVMVDGGPAAGQLRLNVASSGSGFADLESEAGVSLADLAEGTIVTVVETDDPTGDVPRTGFVPLP